MLYSLWRGLYFGLAKNNRLKRDLLADPQQREVLLQQIINRIWKTKEIEAAQSNGVLHRALQEIAALLHLDRCVFLWYFPNTKRVQIVCEWVRGHQKPLPGGYYSLETFGFAVDGSAADAIAQGEIVVRSGSNGGTVLSTVNNWWRGLTKPRFPTSEPMGGLSNFTEMGNPASLVVPLSGEITQAPLAEETLMGFIACFCQQPHHWSAAEIEFVQLIAQQMEIAIRQSQTYEQSQKLLAQEKLLNQIANQTRQSFELETILTEAIAQLLEALQVDRCLVHMVEDSSDTKHHHKPQSIGYRKTATRVAHRRQHLYEVCREPFSPSIDDFDIDGPITQWVIQHNQLVVISDVTQDSRIGLDNQEYQQAQIKSSLVVPVQTKEKLYAILYINQCSCLRYWSRSDRELAQAVANQLAISIQQACLYAQTRASMERESLLRLIGDQIRSTLDLKTILQTTVSEVRQLLETDRALIYHLTPDWRGQVVVEEEKFIPKLASYFERKESEAAIVDSPLEDNSFLKDYVHLYKDGKVRVFNDISTADITQSYAAFLQRFQVQASVVVPIQIGEAVWGLLIVHDCQGKRVWQTTEVELLQQVAIQLAIAIGQAELYAQARKAAQNAQSKATALEQAYQILWSEISDRRQAQEALRQKNKIVQLLQVVAAAANEAATSDQALQICLEQICAYTQWPVGHVYLTNETGELIPSTLWYLENPERFQTFREVTEASRFTPKVGLPGQVLSSHKPIWVVDVNQDPNFPRAKLAKDIGVKAGFAFPVFTGTEVVAVLEFFSSEAIEPDEQLLEIVANIGTQLGRVIERERAERALRQSEAKAKEQARQLKQTLKKLQQTQAQLIQSEKMSSLGQLVAGVAHEINNPVNFIYGNLAFAERYTQDLLELVQLYQLRFPDLSPEIKACADKIDLEFIIEDLPNILSSMQVGAERIRQIVLSLRNFSRLDQANKKPVDIHEGIDSTLLILQNRLKAKEGNRGIEIVKQYGELPLVECYPSQLNQVFMNIITNAIDAIEELKIQDSSGHNSQILIRTEMLTPDMVTVRISDNGPGIPEAVQKRLFDPFFTTKTVGKGTGLGLSISYQIIVEKHGGSLKCISEPGQGTEFLIEIPTQQNQTISE